MTELNLGNGTYELTDGVRNLLIFSNASRTSEVIIAGDGDTLLRAPRPTARRRVQELDGAPSVDEPSATSALVDVRPGAPPVTLRGLRIEGSGDDTLAALTVESSAPVRVRGCVFAYHGGTAVIVRPGSHVVLEACRFESNGRPADGRRSRARGAAVRAHGAFVEIDECVFTSNVAAYGAALYLSGGCAARASRSLLTGNEALEAGGAVYLASAARLALSNRTLLTNNVARTGANLMMGDDSVTAMYVLPAPLGHWVSSARSCEDASLEERALCAVPNATASWLSLGQRPMEGGALEVDLPFVCAPGLIGASSSAAAQSTPQCTGVCPAGYACPSGTVVPVACPIGTFCVPGSPAPTPCPSGFYGRMPLLTNARECTPCEPGFWCRSGARNACGKGFWNSQPLAADIEACSKCPEFSTTLALSATSLDDCVCEAGFYDFRTNETMAAALPASTNQTVALGPNQTVAAWASMAVNTTAPDEAASPPSADTFCARCSLGMGCPKTGNGLVLAGVPLQRGFWRPSRASLDIRKCADAATNCTNAKCEHGTSGCRGGADGASYCAPGLSGPFCELCAPDNTTSLSADVPERSRRVYYEKASSTRIAGCTSCKELVSYTLGVACAVGACVLLTLALLVFLYGRLPRWVRARAVGYWNHARPETKLKIAWGFYAIVSKVDVVYNIPLPNEVRNMLNYISFSISFGLGSSRSVLTCLGFGGFFLQLIFWMALPPVTVVVVLLWGFGALWREAGCRAACTPSQLVLKVLPMMLKALFVLYPLITNVAFEAFSCHEPLDGRAFLVADVSIDCNEDFYLQVVRPLAWIAICVYAFGLIGFTGLLIFCARRAILRSTPTRFSRSIAFLYREYEPWACWWELMEMLRRLVLVGLFVLYERGSIMQIASATIFSMFYLFVLEQAGPFEERSDDYLANGCSLLLTTYLCCCCMYQMGELTEQPAVVGVLSPQLKRFFVVPWVELSAAVLGLVLAALAIAGVILVVQLAEEHLRVRREQANRLPTTPWQLPDEQRYACFLSHYKVEAGAEARYLKDALDAMLSHPSYLDSSTLADLRELFSSGIRKSEVLVLLLTPGLLTRPWCLLEIREAMKESKPIVLLEMTGPGKAFSWEATDKLLDDLETTMPPLNPWCLDEIMSHLHDGETLRDLEATVKRALDRGREQRICNLNINGTTNQLEAELCDLVEAMAAATARDPPHWQGGSRLADELDRQKSKAKGRASRTIEHSTRCARSRMRFRKANQTNSLTMSNTAYVLHEPSAKAHALRLQSGLEQYVRQECYLEVPGTPEKLADCLNLVARAKFALLVQTADVLRHPWPLLATYRAAKAHVPIVCVAVEGSGYDFGGARAQLEDLRAHLSEEVVGEIQRALQELVSPPSELEELQERLASLIPAIISVTHYSEGTDNELMATVHDIQDKRRLLESRFRDDAGLGAGTYPVAPEDAEVRLPRRHGGGRSRRVRVLRVGAWLAHGKTSEGGRGAQGAADGAAAALDVNDEEVTAQANNGGVGTASSFDPAARSNLVGVGGKVGAGVGGKVGAGKLKVSSRLRSARLERAKKLGAVKAQSRAEGARSEASVVDVTVSEVTAPPLFGRADGHQTVI